MTCLSCTSTSGSASSSCSLLVVHPLLSLGPRYQCPMQHSCVAYQHLAGFTTVLFHWHLIIGLLSLAQHHYSVFTYVSILRICGVQICPLFVSKCYIKNGQHKNVTPLFQCPIKNTDHVSNVIKQNTVACIVNYNIHPRIQGGFLVARKPPWP